MPAEKPLTAADIKPGVRVRFRGGEVLRVVAVDEGEGRVQLVSEEPDPSLERSVSGMLKPLLDGRTRYTVVEPTDNELLHCPRAGTHGTTLEALAEAQREVETLQAVIRDAHGALEWWFTKDPGRSQCGCDTERPGHAHGVLKSALEKKP